MSKKKLKEKTATVDFVCDASIGHKESIEELQSILTIGIGARALFNKPKMVGKIQSAEVFTMGEHACASCGCNPHDHNREIEHRLPGCDNCKDCPGMDYN